jgi:hypothetical protein
VPNSRDPQITRANIARRGTFFSRMAFGKCWRVWRVRANQVGESRRIWRVQAKQVGESRRVWRVRAKQVGESWRVWRVLAKPLEECRRKQDRSFYAQITYFICIKRSSLHSLNSRRICQTCLSRVWRVRAKWFGESRRVWRVRHISKKGHFDEYLNSPKMANFRRVLEVAKFAGEWPLLRLSTTFSTLPRVPGLILFRPVSLNFQKVTIVKLFQTQKHLLSSFQI